MPRIDIFTIALFTSLNVLLAAGGLFLVWTLNRNTPGVRRCSMACLIFVVAFASYAARLTIPGKFIVFLPNALVFAALAVLLDGVRAFRGLDRHSGWSGAGFLFYSAVLYYFVFIQDDINARTTVEMFVVMIYSVLLAGSLVTRITERDRYIYWATAAAISIHGAASLFKGLDAVYGPTIQFWSPRPIDAIFTATANLCIIGCAFGLSMAINLKLQRATEVLALYDPLTQLPNRRHFEEMLETIEQRAFAPGERLALVYCDLDDFKGINDQLGHEGGDMALKRVGSCLREMADQRTSVARVGGDEFLLLIRDAQSRDKIHALIERLRSTIEGSFEFGGRSAALKISCGLAIYPDDVGSVSDMIRLADAAMYMMKQHGRSGSPAALSAAAGS